MRFSAVGLVLLVVVGSGAVGVPAAVAGKGGGGGTPVDGGTVYYGTAYTTSYTASSMTSAGSDKTVLPANVWGDPSRDLHGGQRWFLRVETMPGTDVDRLSSKGEIVAVRADGLEMIQLTDGSDSVLPDHSGTSSWLERSRWVGAGDTRAAYLGYTVDASGTPDSWGVFVIEVSWGADGRPIPGAQSLVSTSHMYAPYRPNTAGWRQRTIFAWSPDGSEFAFASSPGPTDFEMYRVVAATQTEFVIADGAKPRAGWVYDWSSTGKIVFQPLVGGVGGGIWSVLPDGGAVTMIVPPPTSGYRNLGDARWSPAGTHLVYSLHDFRQTTKSYVDTRRVAADGTGDVNLTGDISGWAIPIGWR